MSRCTFLEKGDGMDRAGAQRWLDRYVEAWRANDRDLIGDLFSEDISYRYHPYDEPVVGRSKIVDSWLESPDEPDSWEAAYVPYALEGDRLVAIGKSRYDATDKHPARTYHNAFLIEFDSEGRCREFTEYFLREPA
ncbi:MAG TPA: nuclear transport factor 2 family protein [Acidimicrobiia bacterium]|nr:nuclear transport factor 2 family protein [Acidimicrobiia bacterium]